MTWSLPNEEEGYEAAYHDPSRGTASLYWVYPTVSDQAPLPVAASTLGGAPGPSGVVPQ